MNVLHIVPSFFPAWRQGGATEAVYRLCLGVADAGCQVRVLTTDSNGLGHVLAVEKKCEVKVRDVLAVRYCRRLLQESVSPAMLGLLPSYVRWSDVVHLTAVYSFPTIPTLFLTKLIGKPVVWSPHGALQRWQGSSKPKLKSVWDKMCYLGISKKCVLHVTSEEEGKESKQRLPGIETICIPNGIELPHQVNHVPRNDVLRLGFLGRLDPKKGIENLLNACGKIKEKMEFPFSLTIGGSGTPSYTRNIKNTIQTLRLDSHVTMIGHIEASRKNRFFENLDILVVPSHTENFGLVVAEGLAHSVPVIASKGTPWKQLENVGCGLWVDNDCDSLVKSIIRMGQMPLLQMGRHGQEWVEQEFSWPRVARKMTQVYQNLLCEVQ